MATYVETWKGIADMVGRSERWCRYTARREDDPLPVYKVGGIVRIDHPDYERWLQRQRHHRPGRLDLSALPARLELVA
jgi:hypothetical protein